jgi:hypothetical protein
LGCDEWTMIVQKWFSWFYLDYSSAGKYYILYHNEMDDTRALIARVSNDKVN